MLLTPLTVKDEFSIPVMDEVLELHGPQLSQIRFIIRFATKSEWLHQCRKDSFLELTQEL